MRSTVCSEQGGMLEDAVAGKPVTGASQNPSRGRSFRTNMTGNGVDG